jgi:hypothetical protein
MKKYLSDLIASLTSVVYAGLSPVACVVALVGLFAHLPVQANVIYRSQCVDPTPTCDGDAAFNVEFEFTNAIVAGETISAADPKFVGWRAASSIGDGFSIAGTTIFNNLNSEITFTFSNDLTSIVALEDLVSDLIGLNSDGVGIINIEEGSTPFEVFQRADVSPQIVFTLDPVSIVLTRVDVPVGVPLPPTAVLLVAGLVGIAVTRIRLAKKDV